jgi:cytochrome P450
MIAPMTMADVHDVWRDLRMDAPDPNPTLREARARCPVAQSAPIGLDPRPRYNVTLWEDVERVMHDAETFSSSICGESLDPYMGDSILSKDGEAHRAQRRLLARAFRASALDRWEAELIRPIIDSLLDDVAPRGRAELRGEVLAKFPIRVICGMYGVPLRDADEFQQWTDAIIHGIHDPEPAFAAGRAMRDYLRPIVEDRRANPRADLLSDLLVAEADGSRLTEEQFWGTLILILVGGTDTTYQVLGSMVVALLRQPELLEALAADRELIAPFVEEVLRWESPAPRTERRTTRDVTIRGCPIPAGSSVNVWLGSANRDELRFPAPDELRLDRGAERRHMTFGVGPHQCLGIHLARRELRLAVEAIIERLPGLRFDPERDRPAIEGTLLRGPRALHVVWDAVADGPC